MKTVVKNGSYKRVSESIAEKMVREDLWSYTSKTSWKKNVRDASKAKRTEEADEAKEQVLTDKQKKIQKLKAQQR